MKATELVEALQQLIARDGDLEVLIPNPDTGEVEAVTHADTYVGAAGNYIGLDAT